MASRASWLPVNSDAPPNRSQPSMDRLNLKHTHAHALAILPVARLSHQDALIVSLTVGLAVYLVFKRYQPVHFSHHFALLIVPPALLAITVLSPHYSPARAALHAFATHYATLLTATLLYRASPWHPLAHYPGPFRYRLSKLAFAWTASDGRQYLHLDRLHKQYGDIVRIGPNEVSLRNASAIVPVLGPSGLPKGPHWAGRNMTDSAHQLVSLVDVREHARRRRPWNRAFSVPALKGYEEVVARRAEQLVELLARHGSDADPAVLGKCVGSFTYDFMSDMAFGGGSEQMRDGDQDSVWHLMEQGLEASQVMGHCPWLGIYLGYVPVAARLMKQLLDYGEERALARVKNGSLTRDLFYYLNNEDNAEKVPPPLEQVAIDGALAIVAGSDTASNVLTNALFCVLSRPRVYARLRAEVDEVFPPGENALECSKHADMVYLNAVINETMRMYPPLPSGSQRATTRETGGIIAGPYYIPPGTAVNVPFYSLHHDPRNFYPQPDGFWPERWLIAAGLEAYHPPPPDADLNAWSPSSSCSSSPFPSSPSPADATPESAFTHNAHAFIPFSYGPANCVGKGLALQELRAVLCVLMQRLHMRLAHGWDPRQYPGQFREWLVLTKPYFPVVVERRESAGR